MLTYGIFLFLSVFPIIHPKGLTPIPEENMENTELLPLGTEQGREETEYSSFDLCLGESFVSPLVEQHRQWLKSIRHETPSPKIPFKVAVYTRLTPAWSKCMALLCRRQWGENLSGRIPGELLLAASMYFLRI